MDDTTAYTILAGDCRQTLPTLPGASVHCCVTSPPYFGLRSYLPEGHADKALELGSEQTLGQYIANLVAVFREVRRALRADGTLWLNMGDSYNGSGKGGNPGNSPHVKQRTNTGSLSVRNSRSNIDSLKPKDLCGVPWRVAFALQADGWWLRSDIVWSKTSAMPESVTDRPTRAHEYLFLLAPSPRYFYDAQAIAEPAINAPDSIQNDFARSTGKMIGLQMPNGKQPSHRPDRAPTGIKFGGNKCPGGEAHRTYSGNEYEATATRDKRSVWTIASAGYDGAHFATFPPALVEPCVRAGTSAYGVCPACNAPWRRLTTKAFNAQPDIRDADKLRRGSGKGLDASNGMALMPRGTVTVTDRGWEPTCTCERHDVVPATVLDPFAGSGTTGAVARSLGRRFIGCELNPEYITLAMKRIEASQSPLFGL